MEYSGRALSLTPRGALDKNGVIALFHAPSVKGYLLARNPAGSDLLQNREAALRVAKRRPG